VTTTVTTKETIQSGSDYIVTGSGDLTINNGTLNKVTVSSGGTLTANSGSAKIENAIVDSGGTLIAATSSSTLSDIVINNGGTLIVKNDATLSNIKFGTSGGTIIDESSNDASPNSGLFNNQTIYGLSSGDNISIDLSKVRNGIPSSGKYTFTINSDGTKGTLNIIGTNGSTYTNYVVLSGTDSSLYGKEIKKYLRYIIE